jgi:hypothetical protein
MLSGVNASPVSTGMGTLTAAYPDDSLSVMPSAGDFEAVPSMKSSPLMTATPQAGHGEGNGTLAYNHLMSPMGVPIDTSALSSSAGASPAQPQMLPTPRQAPRLVVVPISSLARSKPSVISGCSTTIVHIVMSGLPRQRRASKLSSNKGADNMGLPEDISRMSISSESSSKRSGNEGLVSEVEGRVNKGGGSEADEDITITVRSRKLPNLVSSSAMQPNRANDSSLNSSGVMSETENTATIKSDAEREKERELLLSGKLQDLPQLSVNASGNASMYLLSAYSTANLSYCTDGEVVIGAVAGTVVVSSCTNMSITVACRKLLVISCVNCIFNVATLSPSIISGEAKNITFGPYNASYRNLRSHLKLANLNALMPTQATAASDSTNMGSGTGGEASGETNVNCWSTLACAASCVEQGPRSAGSPKGYAIDAACASTDVILPTPPSSVATILPAEHMKFIAIPNRAENQAPSQCPIPLPIAYQIGFATRRERLVDVQRKLDNLRAQAARGESGDGRKPVGESGVRAGVRAGDDEISSISSSMHPVLKQKFMEWLIESGKAQQVVDLVRLDAEKSAVLKSLAARNEESFSI